MKKKKQRNKIAHKLRESGVEWAMSHKFAKWLVGQSQMDWVKTILKKLETYSRNRIGSCPVYDNEGYCEGYEETYLFTMSGKNYVLVTDIYGLCSCKEHKGFYYDGTSCWDKGSYICADCYYYGPTACNCLIANPN